MKASTHAVATIALVLEPGDDAEAIFMRIAEEFHGLADRTVRDISIDLSTNDVTMSFTFDGIKTPQDAIATAMTLGRTAFHAAGVGTPGPNWDLARWSVEPTPASATASRLPAHA